MIAQLSRPGKPGATRSATPRERIDHAAYQLFSRLGVRAVAVDDVVAKSGVAKATLYRHYPTKNALALAFLRRREELWTRAWLQREVERRRLPPGEGLLAIFDAFDTWFRRSSFEGCSFVSVLLEAHHGDREIRSAAVGHLAVIRELLRELAAEAGVREPEDFARKWHVLMKGSIVAACEGDREAARRARAIGRLLLASEGITTAAGPATPLRRLGRPDRRR